MELAKRLVEEKAEQLAVSSKYKSEFFSNMSHELRTPLNSLLILAEELEANHEENLTDMQVQYAATIRASGGDLLTLLNDILDLAKVESGTVSLTVEDMPFADLKDAIEREFGPVAARQELDFSVELATDLPAAIRTDAGRVRQILKNLLSNGFKFTEDGAVRVHVDVATGGWSPAIETLCDTDTVFAFTVSDTGIGIPTDMQRLIFEAFAQADGGTARQYSGTGLGLSISRELVSLLGGEIAIVSTPGEGSAFTFYLPATLALPAPKETLEAAPVAGTGTRASNGNGHLPALATLNSPRQANGAAAEGPRFGGGVTVTTSSDTADEEVLVPLPPPVQPAGGSMKGLTVLVVDDDFRNTFALTALLTRIGLIVVSAESGEKAIAVLEASPSIDLALVDIMMPGMDGYETMRAVRRLPCGDTLPLVAFTAKAESGERQRCIDAGASCYVPKPVDTEQLLAVLGEWLPAAANRAQTD